LSSSNGYKTALPILMNDGPILIERQFLGHLPQCGRRCGA
jgi:hypothetical protein